MQYFRCITGLFAYSFTSCKPYSAKLKPLTPNRPQQAFRSQTPTTQLYRSDFVVPVRTSYGSGSGFGASHVHRAIASAPGQFQRSFSPHRSASRRSTAIASRSCTRVIILLAKMRSSSRRPELMVHSKSSCTSLRYARPHFVKVGRKDGLQM